MWYVKKKNITPDTNHIYHLLHPLSSLPSHLSSISRFFFLLLATFINICIIGDWDRIIWRCVFGNVEGAKGSNQAVHEAKGDRGGLIGDANRKWHFEVLTLSLAFFLLPSFVISFFEMTSYLFILFIFCCSAIEHPNIIRFLGMCIKVAQLFSSPPLPSPLFWVITNCFISDSTFVYCNRAVRQGKFVNCIFSRSSPPLLCPSSSVSSFGSTFVLLSLFYFIF